MNVNRDLDPWQPLLPLAWAPGPGVRVTDGAACRAGHLDGSSQRAENTDMRTSRPFLLAAMLAVQPLWALADGTVSAPDPVGEALWRSRLLPQLLPLAVFLLAGLLFLVLWLVGRHKHVVRHGATCVLLLALAFSPACTSPKTSPHTAFARSPTEGTVGHPPVTVIGLGGIADAERDRMALVAKMAIAAENTWANRAIYVVVQEPGRGWLVKVNRMPDFDAQGHADSKPLACRYVWIGPDGKSSWESDPSYGIPWYLFIRSLPVTKAN